MQTSITGVSEQAETKLKSYWNRPGGKFGTIFGVGLALAVGWFVLPILTTIVWTTLNFGIALAALGAFLYVVTNRKFRLGLFYFYEILMKKMIGLVIETDPFIILEDNIHDMEKQRDDVFKQTTVIESQRQNIMYKTKEKEKEIHESKTKLKAAEKNGLVKQMAIIAREIARHEDYINRLTPMLEKLTQLSTYLNEIYKNSEYVIQDAKNELESAKDLYKTVTAGNKALNSAMKIFSGDPEKRLLVEQNMEYLITDISNKLGGMQQAMDVTKNFMESIDLTNATFEMRGFEILENQAKQEGRSLNMGGYIPGQIDKNKYQNLLKV